MGGETRESGGRGGGGGGTGLNKQRRTKAGSALLLWAILDISCNNGIDFSFSFLLLVRFF